MIVYTDKRRIPFLIDDEDYEAVSRYKWHVAGTGPYVSTWIGKGAYRRAVTLHVFLMGPPPPGKEWDHKNRDKKDNRRANLRALTHMQNTQNISVRKDSRSGVRGVAWDQTREQWIVRVRVNGVNHNLGRFDSLSEAIEARRGAVRASVDTMSAEA